MQVEKGKYFAWGDTVYRAENKVDGSSCTVERFEVVGEALDVVQFQDDCTPEEALKVCAALEADTTFLGLAERDEEDEDD